MDKVRSGMPGNRQGRLTGERRWNTRQTTSEEDFYMGRLQSKDNTLSSGRRLNLRYHGNRYTGLISSTHGNDIDGLMSFSPPKIGSLTRRRTTELRPEQLKKKLEEEASMRGKNKQTTPTVAHRKLAQPDEKGGIPQNVRYKPDRMVEYLNSLDPATLRRASKGVLKDLFSAFDVLIRLRMRFVNIIRYGWTRETIVGLHEAWLRIAPDLRFAAKSWKEDLRELQNFEDIIIKLLQYKDSFPTDLEYDRLLRQKNAEMARTRRNMSI